MRLGCCAGREAVIGSAGSDAKGIKDRLEWFRECGFDYLELGVSWVAGLEKDAFTALARAVAAGPIPVEACNTFVPAEIPIVGPKRDPERLRSYVQAALDRVKELGCTVVVFGSGGARRFPEGYDSGRAWNELLDFCRMAADEAGRRGITIVLEPLRYQECNVINAVATGYLFVRLVNHPHFQLLADSYHMEEIGEPLSVLYLVYPALRHVHTADTGRCRPGAGTYDHAALFRTLNEVGYQGSVSIECRWVDLEAEAPLAVAHLRQAWRAAEEQSAGRGADSGV